MASLHRIEEMRAELENNNIPTEPDWVFGYHKPDRITMHLSGRLREAAINCSSLPPVIEELLDEAAETLDDAHEEWLQERLLRLRSLRYGE